MQDRAMQALYLQALEPIAATLAEPHSYGFRLARSPADAIDQCHRVLSLRWSAPWIVAGDLRSCFDSISHDWLRANSPMQQAILRQWLTAGFMDKHVLSPTATGVPHGGSASPVLMHLTLKGLERHIRGACPRFQGSQRTKVHVIRVADEVVITGRTRAFREQAGYPRVAQCLAARGLELAYAQTRITHLEDGFAFLGTHLRQDHGTL
jgi:RNA-directed DNA polymerase